MTKVLPDPVGARSRHGGDGLRSKRAVHAVDQITLKFAQAAPRVLCAGMAMVLSNASVSE
jgi:hypothetical protein